MMNRILAVGGAALVSVAGANGANTSTAARTAPMSLITTDMSGSDLEFLNAAAREELAQQALGDLGVKHGEAEPVKTFGEALLKDRAAAQDELERMAAKMKVTLPSSAGARQRKIDKKLEGLTGEAFDKAYAEQVVAVQQREIALYEQGAKSDEPSIQRFAQKALPPLNEHLLVAKKIAGIADAETLFKAQVPVPGGPSPVAEGAVSPDAADVGPAGPPAEEGTLEMADSHLIAGWAYDPSHPNEPLVVQIFDGTTVLATVVAKEFRTDLKNNGKGDGKHFFMLQTPVAFKDGKAHWIRACTMATHFELQGSPKSVICGAAGSPTP